MKHFDTFPQQVFLVLECYEHPTRVYMPVEGPVCWALLRLLGSAVLSSAVTYTREKHQISSSTQCLKNREKNAAGLWEIKPRTFGSVRLLKDDPEPWQKAARAVLAYSVPCTTVGPRDVLCVSEVICTGELLLRGRLDWLPERCRRRGRVKTVKEHWAWGIRERSWETGMWEARCSQCRAVHRPALLPFWWDEYQPVPFSDRPSQQQSKANQHN